MVAEEERTQVILRNIYPDHIKRVRFDDFSMFEPPFFMNATSTYAYTSIVGHMRFAVS